MEKSVENRFVQNSKMLELARTLSQNSRNVGEFGFNVKYNATEGNLQIHEDFIKFSFDKANGEYLVAIGKLLQYYESSKRIDMLEARLEALETLVLDHLSKGDVDGLRKEEEKVVEKKVIKTF